MSFTAANTKRMFSVSVLQRKNSVIDVMRCAHVYVVLSVNENGSNIQQVIYRLWLGYQDMFSNGTIMNRKPNAGLLN